MAFQRSYQSSMLRSSVGYKIKSALCRHWAVLDCGSANLSTHKHFSQSPFTIPDCVIFSGIQPTGVPHLGNYLGALQQWVSLQTDASPSTKLLFSIVDLHAITIHQNPEELRRWKRETLATLLAVGLDPQRCIIFFQSDVSVKTLS